MNTFNWDAIMQDMDKIFRFTAGEKESINKSPAFMLIGALPFLADVVNADRCAYKHLVVAIAAARLQNDVVNFRASDTVDEYTRLESISHFIGGNRKILKKGLALLAYNMLLDYKKDLEQDVKNKKDNPLLINGFNADKRIAKLLKVIESNTIPNDPIDALVAPATMQAQMSAWGFWRA